MTGARDAGRCATKSFNPCFSGYRSVTMIVDVTQIKSLRFNPCFSGYRSVTGLSTLGLYRYY